MKKTNAFNLLAGLFLMLALFYLASCEKEAIVPIDNSELTQSLLKQSSQENIGRFSSTGDRMDETEVSFLTGNSSKKKWGVAIKVILDKDGKHRTLVAVKLYEPSFHFDEHEQYELYWFKGKEKKKLALNSKLHCICGDKYTVVVWHKKSLKRYSATVKVPCPIIFEPKGPGKIPFSKF